MDIRILYKHFKGLASEAELKEIRRWAEESPAHHEEYLRERRFFDSLQLSAMSTGQQARKRTAAFTYFYRAAILLIAFGLGALSAVYLNRADSSLTAMNTITVPAGQCVSITLSDSTQVWLNSKTTFSYPASFDEGRDVYLDGEAFFAVTKKENGDRFTVHTDQCQVEVYGTEFNVEAFHGTNTFNTALLKGSVKIIDNQDPHNNTFLEPNQMATMNHEQFEIAPIEDFDLYRWKEGLICFKETRFDELMLRLEKCYDARIIVRNQAVKQQKFNGKFRISDGLDIILRVLQTESNYQIIRESSELYIIQ